MEHRLDSAIGLETWRPLSWGKASLWVLYSLGQKSGAYNMNYAWRLHRDCDPHRLRAALALLTTRHPLMRARVIQKDGIPYWSIAEKADPVFREIDASVWSEETLANRLREEARRPFELKKEPPSRWLWFHRGQEPPVLLWQLQHVAADLWSVMTVFNQLRFIYHQPPTNGVLRLPAPTRTHADFVERQKRFIRSQTGKKSLDFWRGYLAGPLPLLDLPTDRPRPAAPSFRGDFLRFSIPDDLGRRLQQVGLEAGVSPFVLYLCAFKVFLFRYTHQRDLLVGFPTAGRDERFGGLFGYFVNPVTVRTHPRPELCFSEFLQRVARNLAEVMNHTDLPFPYLVQQIQGEQDRSRTPIFQTCFVWENANRFENRQKHVTGTDDQGRETWDWGGQTWTRIPLKPQFDPFELIMKLVKLKHSLYGILEFNSDLITRARALPLSFAQQRLWFFQQLHPDNPAHHMPLLLEMRGSLSADDLERALNHNLERHEAMRTVFPKQQGRPVQWINPCYYSTLPLLDLATLNGTKLGKNRLEEVLNRECRRGFSMEDGPLVRFLLIKSAPEAFMLLITMHHIISDGWSMNLFSRETADHYARQLGIKRRQAPKPSLHFADYAAWQQTWLQGEALERRFAFWKDYLHGAATVLDLPTDYKRPKITHLRGDRHDFSLTPGLVGQIRRLGRERTATLFMTLFSAFAVLLHRYTSRVDFLIGTPMAQRNHAAAESMLGCFVNTLVLRALIQPKHAFSGFLDQMRTSCLRAYAQADFPFEQLVKRLQPERDLSRNPFFQVMFILQNPSQKLRFPALRVHHQELNRGMSHFDLTLSLEEREGGLSGYIEYSSELFSPETITRWAAHYSRVLEAVCRDADRPIQSMVFLTEAEKKTLLIDFNHTAEKNPRLDLLTYLRGSQTAPDHSVLSFGRHWLTRCALWRLARCLATQLRRRNIGPEDRVGLCLDRSPQMLSGLLGILEAGAAYVPLDPNLPPERLKIIAADAGCRLVLTQSNRLPGLFLGEQLFLDQIADRPDEGPTEEPIKEAAAQNPAYVIYTSGSTGHPKGVQVSRGALINFLLAMSRDPGLSPDQVLLAVTTLSFDIAGLELLLPLVVGGRICLAQGDQLMDGKALRTLLERERAAMMQATPVTWNMLLRAGWHPPAGFKMLCGGEALPLETAKRLSAYSAPLWNLYGPTETTIWSSAQRIVSAAEPVPIGRPIRNTQLYVLDRHLMPVLQTAVGQLFIGGLGLARGYHQRPALTAEKWLPHPFADSPGSRLYASGDRARFNRLGELECLGRLDDQAKLRHI